MKIVPQPMPVVPAASRPPVATPSDGQNGSFQAMLKDALHEVNAAQLTAEKTAQELAAGGEVDFHRVMLAAEKANLSLQLTVQIRNKLVEAYQEIMRMQV